MVLTWSQNKDVTLPNFKVNKCPDHLIPWFICTAAGNRPYLSFFLIELHKPGKYYIYMLQLMYHLDYYALQLMIIVFANTTPNFKTDLSK